MTEASSICDEPDQSDSHHSGSIPGDSNTKNNEAKHNESDKLPVGTYNNGKYIDELNKDIPNNNQQHMQAEAPKATSSSSLLAIGDDKAHGGPPNHDDLVVGTHQAETEATETETDMETSKSEETKLLHSSLVAERRKSSSSQDYPSGATSRRHSRKDSISSTTKFTGLDSHKQRTSIGTPILASYHQSNFKSTEKHEVSGNHEQNDSSVADTQRRARERARSVTSQVSVKSLTRHEQTSTSTAPGATSNHNSKLSGHSQSALPATRRVAVRSRSSRSQPPSGRRVTPQMGAESRTSTLRTESRAAKRLSKNSASSSRRGLHKNELQNDDKVSMGRRNLLIASPGTDVRQTLEKLAQDEGPLEHPEVCLRKALHSLSHSSWPIKVDGILDTLRIVSHHKQVLLTANSLHDCISRLVVETQNLRSVVSRAAIYTLGTMCKLLGRDIELELDRIVSALLNKSGENSSFIRDDVRQSLVLIASSEINPLKFVGSLINHGSQHKNSQVRRIASRSVADLVQQLGPSGCFSKVTSSRDLATQLILATAKFARDNSPQTRFYGRQCLSVLLKNNQFDKMLLKALGHSSLYRDTVDLVDCIKRKGVGERPED